MGANARLIRSEFVNDTAQPQNLVLHYMAYLSFPPVRTHSDEPVRACRAILPPGAVWLDSLDYDDLRFAIGRPTGSDFTVITAMDPGSAYQVAWNGEPVNYHERYSGVLEVMLDSLPTGQLTILPKK